MLTISSIDGAMIVPGETTGNSDDAYGKTAVCPVDGSCSANGVRALRGSVRRQSQGEALQLHGPVPVHGLRAVDVSGKPARHRGVPALTSREAVSHGYSCAGGVQHVGERK